MDKKLLLTGCFAAATSLLTACTPHPTSSADPYENFNRAMFKFNNGLDKVILRPVAKTYNFITPQFVQNGVTNVYDNMDEMTSIPNDFLQGKFLFMLNDFWRVVINTTVGVGGLFDVAKHMQLRPHYENFGLTIAYWERNQVTSSYLVLPFFGPGTIRSAVGRVIDSPTAPYFYVNINYWYVPVAIRAFEGVNYRAQLLPADGLVNASFDPYVFIRDAYLQTMTKRTAINQVENYGSATTLGKQSLTAENLKASSSTSEPNNNQNNSAGYSLGNPEEAELLFGPLYTAPPKNKSAQQTQPQNQKQSSTKKNISLSQKPQGS